MTLAGEGQQHLQARGIDLLDARGAEADRIDQVDALEQFGTQGHRFADGQVCAEARSTGTVTPAAAARAAPTRLRPATRARGFAGFFPITKVILPLQGTVVLT